ncbi:GNAT family N-acetyltransferase [Planctomycetaceae bacterium]|jgi:GNAT superfamily N-acetyltransferase|nr:GNAT family N-acetyltransferase [bacterium]MDC0261823.1 GNAT family N-acetyltransferase [Planctomycetaceae bacterium]MDC0274197.1 GNAT family N-acetyltransferase [Planctomycetaceae bacterium]MDC0307934.1 GNAT family N-acetyltransferase [Planctomycetaceae bacterium]MDG2390179.1 GNAT family N-acetyltransferase [Planctomycetaceae bacterium]
MTVENENPELVDVTVFHLEMCSRPAREVRVPEGRLEVLEVASPAIAYYRFLYDAVGQDYRWLSRRKMSDTELAAVIHHPDTEMFVLHVDGCPAGFAELDCRDRNEIELVQFGLMGEYHGRGLGGWFLNWVIDTVWSRTPERFWLHTCTFDHPAALGMYQKAGFQIFKEEQLKREY